MTTLTANTADRQTFLRRVLHVDGATCIAMGALLTQDAALIASHTALPAALLHYAGIALFPIGAFMFLVSTRRTIPVLGAWAVIAGNALWIVGSALVLALTTPTGLGWAFVIAQAIVVAALAGLEVVGLQKIA